MRRTHAIGTLLLALALTLAIPAAAQEQFAEVRTKAEIDYLIERVRGSPCIFLRNGDPYDGAEAAAHIVDKYDYFRDEIKTAEDFIDRAASRSLLSGRPYQITCPGAATIHTRDWLRAALAAYRSHHQQQNMP